MELKHIKELAHDLMENFDLYGWGFEFSNTTRAIGDCLGTSKRIRYSKKYAHLEYSEIKDTILHEIAHALDYKRYGSSSHGKRWKNIAIEVGAIPKARKNVSAPARKKWKSYCDKCGKFTGYVDRRGKYRHKPCKYSTIIYKPNND